MLISTHASWSTLTVPFTPVTWQEVSDSSFSTTDVNAVTYNGSIYVAVGDEGKIGTSSDGITWTQRPNVFGSSNIYDIAYGNGIFVAVGAEGKMAKSSDGLSWVLETSSFGSSPILAIEYFEGFEVWVAAGASGKLATSPIDADSWTQRLSSFGTTFINDLYAIDSLIVAVGYDGKLATSTNGSSWTQRDSTFLFTPIFAVTSNPEGTRYIAVGDFGKIATSNDAFSWTPSFPAEFFGASTLRAADERDGVYVAAGSSGKLGTSFDGDSWIQRDSDFGVSGINDLLMRTSFVIAVGEDGKIAYAA